MARQISTRPVRLTSPAVQQGPAFTKILIACGVLAGCIFMPVALVQALTRPGFDIRRHPVSLLLLGDQGWVQVLNFVGCGLLFLALATGARRLLRQGPAATWGPLLLGGFGLGMVIAGVFHPDAALGFPPGTPAGTPASLSWHNWLHTMGFLLAFGSVIAACFVFARRFASLGRTGWTRYSRATGAGLPVLIVIGIAVAPVAGLGFAAAGLLASAWMAAVAVKLLADPGTV